MNTINIFKNKKCYVILYMIDVIAITSLVIAAGVTLGVIAKECYFKKCHSNCGTCCNFDLETKTPTAMSGSPSGTSANLPSIDKLAKFIKDTQADAAHIIQASKDEAEKVIETFRRFSDPLITIPPTNKI